MLLAIDVGNTNINFGIFCANKLIRRFFIPTKDYRLQKLKQNLTKLEISDAIVCSVVPVKTKKLQKDLNKLLHRQTYILGKNITVPIKNLYRYPKQVGQDRLVNAYSASLFYGAPLIVIDFGTAITFDIVSKNKEYLGGMILPGLGISRDALSERTALLPKIELKNPKEFIGRDTKSSILSGIIYGFAALADDLAGKIKKNIGKDALVIGTGGNIGLIAKYCKAMDKADPDLTLEGLNLLYQEKCAE